MHYTWASILRIQCSPTFDVDLETGILSFRAWKNLVVLTWWKLIRIQEILVLRISIGCMKVQWHLLSFFRWHWSWINFHHLLAHNWSVDLITSTCRVHITFHLRIVLQSNQQIVWTIEFQHNTKINGTLSLSRYHIDILLLKLCMKSVSKKFQKEFSDGWK